MNMQERVCELELQYKKYLLKKIFKYLFFIFFAIIVIGMIFFIMQGHYQQKVSSLKVLEYKKILDQKILQAQILQEKNKIIKEAQDKKIEELDQIQENNIKINIDSKIINIYDLKKQFYQNPSYKKALVLSNYYYKNKNYKKSIFWALKANDIDKTAKESWLVFIKSKKALGDIEEANKALNAYVKYYGVIELER